MVFSNTEDKNGIIQRVEDYAGFDDGVITGDSTLLKKFTANVNEALFDITTEIMVANDSFDWDDPTKVDYPIATTPLVASQRDYQFDSISFLKLKRVDITYDGTNWHRATPFDSGAYYDGLGNDSKVDENFTKTAPMYDPKAFGFWLYPMAEAADVSAGAKARIEFTRAFTEFASTDTTKAPPIDRPFHDLIAVGAALKWPNLSDGQYVKLQGYWNRGLEQLRLYYSKRNEDTVKSFKANFNQDYT